MNDWPADPQLDNSLRRLVDLELDEARSEVIDLPMHRVVRRGRTLVPLATAGVVTVAVLVAAIALRGSFGGVAAGPGAGSESTPAPSPSAASSPDATGTASRSGDGSVSDTPGASLTAGPTASANFHTTGMPVTPDITSATRLVDGRVLLIGNAPTSPQVYDPKTDKFTRTGALPVVAEGATATLLSDGRVLITGGHTTATVAAAEIFDPTTGTFTATGSMTEPRGYHTATLLADGRVLIAGGIAVTYGFTTNTEADRRPGVTGAGPRSNAYGPPGTDTAELYDPKTGTFTATGSMTIARDGASAVRLADGRVLVCGGDVNVGSLSQDTIPPTPDHATAEIYNPATGKFSAAGAPGTSNLRNSSVLLRDGRVLIAGVPDPVNSSSSFSIYDPATGTYLSNDSYVGATGDSGAAIAAGTKLFFNSVALLADGRVLLVGAQTLDSASGVTTVTSRCALYDPASGKTSPAGESAYIGIATTLLDGRVLITGNETGAPAELYIP